MALSLLGEGQAFGIVSTGEVWKQILGDAIHHDLLGSEKASRVFVDVETLGLNAGELHQEGEVEVVKTRVMAATGRLIDGGSAVKKDVSVVLLGCAGMAGMEEWVREEVQKRGKVTRVVDGVKAGIGILQGLLRGQF